MFRKNCVALFAVIAFIISTGFVCAGPLEDCAEYTTLGVPGQDGDLLCRTGYLLAHSPDKKTPIWVIEHLTADKAASTEVPRYDKFQADPDLAKGNRSELKDYLGSGYDRGHMAPAADMKWDQKAMEECFYLSNMVPQVGKGMNRGIWKDLEEKVRNWAIAREEVYIFTGPIYAAKTKKTVGKNKVAVPTHLYKIVYDGNNNEAIAFIMPNRVLNTRDMPKYIVTIRDVEEKTGLDFLSNLEKNVENTVETTKAKGLWK